MILHEVQTVKKTNLNKQKQTVSPHSPIPTLHHRCAPKHSLYWLVCYVKNTEIQTYLLTYLLTPWSRVLLEKLTSLQPVKKFSAFYGTRRFITSFTSARHLSLSWASSIQSIPPHPTSWRSILILPSHLCLGLPSVISGSLSTRHGTSSGCGWRNGHQYGG
jgi:hypothetical protein